MFRDNEVKKEVIKKLTRKQVFILSLTFIFFLSLVIIFLAIYAPTSLKYLFGAVG